ncbi:MAG: tRNA (adenosine(37)-N6)-threonylcarbamoyltransferase complex dimerization subunit type 1 TsaB [Oscillospiraceae bacterium]|jgi:tRNA threonylcarbamoyladenosine biosynthesis protein TsaB|nr:tRNA (adenosine(37)-N6)-threonylcarbamoyltransferase complex dimerization subunit type 1 TsaB [Oscillospiraceae bacterium]
MNILALDTSSKAVSCALLRDGILAGEAFLNTGLTHSQTAVPLVDGLLRGAGVKIGEVDIFAVSTGPGSFTGLRIGIATVKGFAFTGNTLCAPVSTLLGLAMNIPIFKGFVVPVMDARREQVYTAIFEADGEGSVVRRGEDEAISIASLGKKLMSLAPAPVILTGDGALMAYEKLGIPEHVRPAPERFLHQRAGSVAAAAYRLAKDGGLVLPEELEPVYLRLPQAERERLEKKAKETDSI